MGRMVNKKLLVLLCLLSISGVFISAQIPYRPYIIHYTNRDYQADFQNWSVSLAPDKTVFIGNNTGLLEFDGTNWSLHEMTDQLVVRSVSAENDSAVFVGAYEEFGYFLRSPVGDLQYISISDSLHKDYFHNDEIWRIIPLHDKIYFQSFNSIYVYDGIELETIKPGFTIVLLQKADNRLFIHGVDRGLFEIVDDKLKFIPGSAFLADDEIKVVLPYENDKFILGAAQNGLFVLEDQTIEPWKCENHDLIKKAGINNGTLVGDKLVFGTIANGIFIFDKSGNEIHHLNTSNQLINNTVLSLITEDNNNIWVALYGGIEFIQLNNEISFFMDRKGELGSVFSAAIQEDDLLIGTNRGLYRFDKSAIQSFDIPDFIEGSQGPSWTLLPVNDEIWLGHNNGTYRIQGNTLELISDHNGGYCFRTLTREQEEFMIQSSYSPLVVYKKEDGNWQFSHTINGFQEPVNYFEFDFQGNIWANHATKGIFRIKLNEDLDSVRTYEYIGMNEGLPTERNLFVSKVENRIVFTTEELLYTYDDLTDTIISYDQLNDQVGEFKKASRIIPIRDNNYWFILSDRIGWFRIEDQIAELRYEYYLNQYDAYLNSVYPKIIPVTDSTQVICLENGFSVLDETKMNFPEIKPGIRFEKIITRNKNNHLIRKRTEMSDDINKIPYEFRNIHFTISTNVRVPFPEFSFYLKGLDEDWSPWTESSEISYTRLPLGKYEFKIKSINPRGIESAIITYPFEISPPWYSSRIAMIIYIVVILIFGLLLRIFFLKRLRRQSMKFALEEKEKRKQENLEAERRYMKLKNEKLQSELNHQNNELTNRAMAIVQKNELLMKIKEELVKLNDGFSDGNQTKSFNRLFNMIDHNIHSEEDWQDFEIHFDQANQNFFKRLKTQYPDLTSNDLRLCAYLRMNLSSKEIAPLLNISLRGVEIKRYRLRKRLNLESEESLIDFLITF